LFSCSYSSSCPLPLGEVADPESEYKERVQRLLKVYSFGSEASFGSFHSVCKLLLAKSVCVCCLVILGTRVEHKPRI